jgi:hypothetical protein
MGAAIGCSATPEGADRGASDLGDAGVLSSSDAGTSDTGCVYPVGELGFEPGEIFPDYALGVGFINFDGRIDALRDSDAGLVSAADVLLQMHCSGARYLMIDLSTMWCPVSEELAEKLSGTYAAGWLAQGGLVMTVLEQGPTASGDGGFPPATGENLVRWAVQFGTNYSLVNDPTEAIDEAAGVKAWPALVIIDLSTMHVLTSVYGEGDSVFDTYSEILSWRPDGG